MIGRFKPKRFVNLIVIDVMVSSLLGFSR